jgi:hypothetical protein
MLICLFKNISVTRHEGVWSQPQGLDFRRIIKIGSCISCVQSRLGQQGPNNLTEDVEVAIFWDIENCPPPSKMRGIAVERQLRKALRQYGKIYQINAYAEMMNIPQELRVELQRSGIHLIDTPHVKEKEVADFMIMTDMFVFAHKNSPPQHIALISGDSGFAYTLAKLRQLDYEVVLVVPPSGVSSILREQADIILEWNEIMDVQAPVIEDSELKFEPLLKVIRDLSEKGIDEPTVSEIEELLNKKYPAWSKMAGFEVVSDYIESAASSSIVVTYSKDETTRVRIVEDEGEDIDYTTSRFDPLITVLNQLGEKGDDEPELAIIGVVLRTLMTDPLEKLGVSRLKDYVMEAEQAGVVNVRQDGLQYYISLKSEGLIEEISLEEKETLDLLELALESLRGEMIMPTPKAVRGRMSELHPQWSLARSKYKDESQLITAAQKHRGVTTKAVGSSLVVFPKSGEFEFIDLMDGNNPYTPEQWIAFYDYLLKNKESWVKGRYAFAKRIQAAEIEQLGKLKLGHLIHMVQIAINEASLGKKIGSWDSFIPIESNIEVLREQYLQKK